MRISYSCKADRIQGSQNKFCAELYENGASEVSQYIFDLSRQRGSSDFFLNVFIEAREVIF